MNVVGIVAEYNPFHNGHFYHLQKAKQEATADYSVAIMSSNFVQRGEPGIFNKWQRAEMAVLNGVDLVLELPVLFSSRSAYYFAFGSIYSLIKSNTVTHLAFGSEAGDLGTLKKIAEFISEENTAFKTQLHKYLDLGYSFPKARELCIIDFYPSLKIDLNQPNVILGLNYLKVLHEYNSKIIPIAVERIGTYHGLKATDNIAGATLIRNLIESGNSDYRKYLTCSTNDYIDKITKNGFQPVFLKDFEKQIIYLLRTITKEKMLEYPGVKEGLENKIKNSLIESQNIYELIRIINSKRYTETRIKRILIEILLGIHYQDNLLKPQYLRILALNNKGRTLAKNMQDQGSLPVITKFADFYHTASPDAKRILDLDILATNVYSQAQKNNKFNKYNQEFTNSPVFLS